MSPMDKETLNQMAWEYVLKIYEISFSAWDEAEKLHHSMVSAFGVHETNESIKAMQFAMELMGNQSIQMRWYHGLTIRNPTRNILSGYTS